MWRRAITIAALLAIAGAAGATEPGPDIERLVRDIQQYREALSRWDALIELTETWAYEAERERDAVADFINTDFPYIEIESGELRHQNFI